MTLLQDRPEETLVDQLDAWLSCRADMMEDPIPFCHRLREGAPVLLRGSRAFASRYVDVELIARDYRLFSVDRSQSVDTFLPPNLTDEEAELFRTVYRFFDLWMTSTDPPGHARLRGLVHMAFTPRRVAAMRREIEAITDDLIARARSRGAINVVDDYAYRLPMDVICSMLGFPREDWDAVREWSDTIAAFMGGNMSELTQVVASIEKFRAYVRELAAERRENPAADDLLAALVTAESEGDRLTEDELEGMVVLLAFAGHETTTGMISNGLYHLLTHPDQLEILRNDWSLMPQAVEEILRYDSNVSAIHRIAVQDVVLSGVTIPAGTNVVGLIAAANRDPEVFEEPDAFNIVRTGSKHLTFSVGPHYCLGQALARLEAPIALERLLREFPRLEIAGEITWRRNWQLRQVSALPIELNDGTSPRMTGLPHS